MCEKFNFLTTVLYLFFPCILPQRGLSVFANYGLNTNGQAVCFLNINFIQKI